MLSKKWLLQHQLIMASVAFLVLVLTLGFTSQIFLFKGTVLSVSNITIEPQGYEDPATGEWKGSFWVILMTTDMSDQVASYKFDEAESEKGTNTIGDDTLVPQSTVTIRIDPEQPYYERELEIQQVMVSPKTSGAWANAFGGWGKMSEEDATCEPVYSGHYEFGVGSWTLHTPFKVTVLKNGVQIGEKTINTVGGTGIYRIPETGDEYVHITDLGKLGTGYGEPQIDNLLYFSNDYIFEADAYARNLIKFDGTGGLSGSDVSAFQSQDGESYSTYWFGTLRWADDKTPAGFLDRPGLTPSLVDSDDFGGWARRDDWARNAVAPPIFPGDKPTGKMAFMSLMEYLTYKGISKVSMPNWLNRIEVTDDKKMRLYMPFGAVSSLITVKISTELADTIVWQPLVANFEITEFPDFGDIADRITTTITIKCLEGGGSGTIWLSKEPEDAPISINPLTIGTGSMKAGDIKTFDVEILNLGTEQEISGRLRAGVKNALGTETDHAYAKFKLLKKTGAETILTVKTIYQEDKSVVTGITITVEYAEQSKSGITNTAGQGLITFSLGSYEGNVDITSASTDIYKSQSATAHVTAGQQTTVVLELYKYDEPEPEIPWLLIIAVLVVVIVAAVGVLFVYRKRLLRRGR